MGVELFDPIKTASAVSDSVIVSFSGGKESIVVLDMCMRHFERVAAFHMYQFPHLSFSDEQIDWYERRYPGLEILDLPHPNLSMNMRYGAFRPPNPDVPLIGFNDVYGYVRWATGIHWIAAGERVSDSLVRRAMIKHSGTVDPVRGRFYPVANWNKADVLHYIKVHKLSFGAVPFRLVIKPLQLRIQIELGFGAVPFRLVIKHVNASNVDLPVLEQCHFDW